MNNKELKKYGLSLYKKWKKKLTFEEKKALIKYKVFNSYAKKLNGDLRNNKNRNDAAIIRKALKKSVIDRNLILLRNTDYKIFENNNLSPENISVGDILIDKAFLSTSLYQTKIRFKNKVLFKINCPIGTQGGYMDKFGISWNEREILLNGPCKLIVKKVEHTDKQLILEVDYEPLNI